MQQYTWDDPATRFKWGFQDGLRDARRWAEGFVPEVPKTTDETYIRGYRLGRES